jgi:hypothetical protein
MYEITQYRKFAKNPNTPLHIIEEIINYEDISIEADLAKNMSAPEVIIAPLVSGRKKGRIALAKRKVLPINLINILANDPKILYFKRPHLII